jgi:hypothetical protein
MEDVRRVAAVVRSRAAGQPEKGIALGFWMGKDSKDHPLGVAGRRAVRVRRVGRPQLGAFGGDGARVPAEGARAAETRLQVRIDDQEAPAPKSVESEKVKTAQVEAR